MPACFFATDLHGHIERYDKLFASIAAERPTAVFLGGDLLPKGASYRPGFEAASADFIERRLIPGFVRLRESMGSGYPVVLLILGNDDPRFEESRLLGASERGIWKYLQQRKTSLCGFDIFGYAYVPPTPFHLKDWERYDVSRHVDPGCLSPEEGYRSVPVPPDEIRFRTIQKDLVELAADAPLDRAIFLFHTPPYDTPLDRAALDGRSVDHAPLDVHVGSIAVRRFIEERQPRVTLHGHVHESARLTGTWKMKMGKTVCINAAHDGPELSLVRFDPDDPDAATRQLL